MMPFGPPLVGMSHWTETPGSTHDLLERLILTIGLGKFGDPLRRREKYEQALLSLFPLLPQTGTTEENE